jgi:uncharacterized protein involved in response to NO
VSGLVFLSRGFRPFFLGASVFAVASMASWLSVYHYGLQLRLEGLSVFQWHAHEMLFGYSMAVIAGFLLTAAWNWTDRKTADGGWLALIFALWALARILMINGTEFILYAAVADLAFMTGLGMAVAMPVIKVRQKRQAMVLLLVLLLAVSNLLFYLGVSGVVEQGVRLGIQGGLYLVLGLVLFMGRRVIPFFTERGVGYPVELKNSRRNDIATYILYPAFLVNEVFFQHQLAGALIAAGLFVSNSIRLNGWHTLGLWQKPLLWGLFASFLMINLGFLLRALMPVTTLPDSLAVHAFTVGGIGIVTVSMMARVTLGHTGRNVYQSPHLMTVLLLCMVLAAMIRVFFPLMDPVDYQFWIFVAGIIWIFGFTLFSIIFVPMLVKPRADANKTSGSE